MTGSVADRAPLGRGGVLEFSLVRKEPAPRAVEKAGQPAANDSTWLIERAGVRCSGVHVIVDLFDAHQLHDPQVVEQTLRRCVEAAGATLLHIHLQRSEPNGGISAVAVLAESHISIHTWPERGFAALDIFMCGKARPERCLEVLLEAFSPRRAEIQELLRGRMNE